VDDTSAFQDRLLATKLFVPRSSHPLIQRPRLTTLLMQGLQRKLTLISAPAGFGKTTLLSSWVQSLPQDAPDLQCVAWISLDEDDNEPALFWSYVLKALDTLQPGLCTSLLTYQQTQQAPSVPIRSVLQTLINTLAGRNEQFLLILDDYHVITESKVHQSLIYFLEHLPLQMHIMIATRADPPLQLSLLRARGEVLEIRTSQLRCTLEEGTAFLEEVMDIHLPMEISQEVDARTEGWLVGLQLLGLSLQRRTDPAHLLEEVSGSQRYILDYLMEEILQRQRPPVQTFLLRTSILERLSAPLCDALLEQTGSQQILAFLECYNVFVVPLDGQRHWYRYHTLFAEALRSRLEQTEGETVSALHLRASHWYARQGSFTEAIRHAISACAWTQAADLIEQKYAPIWASSEHAMVRRWIEKLPVEVVRSRPRLCLMHAKTLFMIAPYATIESWLHNAESALQATVPVPTDETTAPDTASLFERTAWDNLLGEIIAYRAIITGYNHSEGPATLALCQEAMAHLSEQNILVRAEIGYARSLAYYSLGDIVASIHCTRESTALAQAVGNTSSTIFYLCRTAYSLLIQGKLHEVVQVTEHIARLGKTPVGLPHAMVSWAYIHRANVLRQWNRLDEALNLILQSIWLCEQTETIMPLYLGYTALMRVYLASGEMDAARLAFQQAEEALSKTYSPYRRDVYVIGDWVQFWLASGDVERATRWEQELTQQASPSSSLACERRKVARVRILLARKQPGAALSLLEPLLVVAEKQERLSHVIGMKILQALAYQMHQQMKEAIGALSQAVQLAEPEGYIRCFLDEGPLMATLLSRLQRQKHKHGPTLYLDELLAAFPQADTGARQCSERPGQLRMLQPLLNPLSERELEVLCLMIQGDSNQRIAETLVLSIDTVKRHVSNIFSKFVVHTRVQAVARARSLGLLRDEL
jgi:LuxR family transcriptional regulator, maltose regulon positive regulatory protein